MTASTTYPQSLVINYDYKAGKVTEQASTMNAKEFMLSGGQGVYTAMRTVCGGSRIFLLDDHLQRISNSHRMVLADSEQQKDPEHWRNLLVPIIRRGLESFKSTTENDDRKITILVGTDHVSLQLTELKAPLNGICWVKFVQGKRHNPVAKDLQWVHDRERLEKQIISPINEIVLIESGPETRVYEGLSSNFFATRRVSEDKQPGYANFELLSAPLDSVLLGTIMKLVLRICERDCIKVVYDSRVDFSRWSGAFVSSTSRLVLPVSKIITDCGEHLMDSRDPLVVHLLESVKGLAREQSTEI
ncbi:hypothetical protein H4R99_000196 [Coemansia sp. RSA 1722]|nr:hypothetical protein IWW45_006930 [Coemansia sp. RSA 485]KAJ2601358.1 hypothetical protein GGF39_001274 [Coemansia sp. RSA 1721]KAJ2606770.1 hypothetical protein H4R99_000196 [Coemansia sp. RSA 1722]KAJ2638860.1 hypothetical protein GGF40_001336 [Coemansia sp. RSA 1286]